MIKLSYGNNNQVNFANLNEFYKVLGYLAKSDGTTAITWEHNENQGAWGSEGRIHINENNQRFPANFIYTAGNGSTCFRVNCNEYVECLRDDFGFSLGMTQNILSIRNLVPDIYKADFDSGLAL